MRSFRFFSKAIASATFLFLAGTSHGAASVVTLAIDAAPRSIDPRYAVDANSQYVENLIHCSVIGFDKDGKTVPELAEKWKWVSPTALEVILKKSIVFSDGSPVTPADVQATYMFFKNETLKNPSPRKSAFTNLKNISVAKDAVTFELNEADSTFLLNLVVGILPASYSSKEMLIETDKIVGCGPFTFTSMNANELLMTANSKYNLASPPKAAGVTIKFVKDETTRYAKLQAGEIDIVQNSISRDKVNDIATKSPSLQVLRRAGLNTTYLGFNMKDKLVGNEKVRQAINQAIDREKIIKYVLSGLAIPANTMLPPTDSFFSKSLAKSTFNPEAAKKLLDEAGFKDPDGDGKKPRFALSYKTTTDLTRISIAKAIAADLKKVGIDVTVESLEWGKFKADVEAGKVQMWSLAWVGFKDPDIYRFAFATEAFPPNGGNRGWFSDKELDSLLNSGKIETDTAKRVEIYNKVQELVAKHLPYVFLWHEEIFAVVSKKVEGFEVYADGRYASLATAQKK
jgi:peptide/nickel transport system substrate-binding protein